jgi:propanol-preferring alcohol dehydrogenase
MKAMVLTRIASLSDNPSPLSWRDLPDPTPGEGQVLIKVSACGVCHTELDEIEGRMPPPRLPVVLGHQVVGTVIASGPGAPLELSGVRVGVAWIYSACGRCSYCLSGQENLCAAFKATGRDANGGYAEYMLAPAAFTHPIPPVFSDTEAAPLLCAGAVGYRSMRLAGLRDGQRVGLTGFGASGHLVLKMIHQRYPNAQVFVFARSLQEQDFARELGAVWAGDTLDQAPELLDSIIDTTPVWTPIVEALRNLRPGGRLVINAIRKEDADKEVLSNLDYSSHLWMEKEVKSVANVTRSDVRDFLILAAQIPISPEIQEYPLVDANQALAELKQRKIRGAKVLIV